MNDKNALKLANFHFESATFRVVVDDADLININNLEDTKPDYVLGLSKSGDPERKEWSILVDVVDGYNLEEMAKWFYENC